MNSISVIGLGYIGLPTAVVFADSGFDVLGVDVNPVAVEAVNAGTPHIFEPGLAELLKQVVDTGRLRAAIAPEPSDSFIIAVPTPFKENNEPDLRFIKSAADAIAPVLASGNLVVLESTSPVGATEQLADWLADARPDLRFPRNGSTDEVDVHISYCPERVLPGKILHELRNNDRLLGGVSPACAERAAALYKSFVIGECRTTSARTAEMAKLSENAFRDVNIAFANELSVISDQLDIDVSELIELANLHPRVNILNPGTGVGGHCIAVDPWFIVHSAPEAARLIKTARAVNDDKPGWVVHKILDAVERRRRAGTAAPVVACLGLAYKPNIDDLRESPAIDVVQQLARALPDSGGLLVVEPNVNEMPAELAKFDVRLVTLEEAADAADIIVGLVSHNEFANIAVLATEADVVDPAGIWK